METVANVDFRSLFELSPARLLVLDSELRIITCSKLYRDTVVCPEHLVPGRSLDEVFPLRQYHELRDSLVKVVNDKTGNSVELGQYPLAEYSDVRDRRWRASNCPVVDRYGKVEVVIHQVEEITQQYHRERELKQEVSTRDEMLSIASHELKTPVTSLRFLLQVLQRKALRGWAEPVNSPAVIEKLQMADKQIKRISDLIEELLEVSRIRTNRLHLIVDETDFSETIREIANRFHEEAKAAGCTIDLKIEDHIYGLWDRLRLEQVAANLISNAIKYGGGKPIEISLVNLPSTVLFCVCDHGMGISPEDQQRIFKRFERAVDESQHRAGLGLGLYIATQIVQAHGGKIWVESEPGNGSKFWVEMPKFYMRSTLNQQDARVCS